MSSTLSTFVVPSDVTFGDFSGDKSTLARTEAVKAYRSHAPKSAEWLAAIADAGSLMGDITAHSSADTLADMAKRAKVASDAIRRYRMTLITDWVTAYPSASIKAVGVGIAAGLDTMAASDRQKFARDVKTAKVTAAVKGTDITAAEVRKIVAGSEAGLIDSITAAVKKGETPVLPESIRPVKDGAAKVIVGSDIVKMAQALTDALAKVDVATITVAHYDAIMATMAKASERMAKVTPVKE